LHLGFSWKPFHPAETAARPYDLIETAGHGSACFASVVIGFSLELGDTSAADWWSNAAGELLVACFGAEKGRPLRWS